MIFNRRNFLKSSLAAFAASLAGFQGLSYASKRLGFKPGLLGKRLSPFYESLEGKSIKCTLCPKMCEVEKGERGECQVRENINGKYYTLVYGNPCAAHVDPIEKKPFFHVLPGTKSFSLATAGCNFSCLFCQNWEISQKSPDQTINMALTPKEAVLSAIDSGCFSLASTYVEPTIFMEYMLDLGKNCQNQGILKVMHSNGYMNQKPLNELIKVLDAACIDLKSSQESFYEKICNGSLKPVKKTLIKLKENKVHTEIVNLVIPGLNDSSKDIKALIRFILDDLTPDTPLHFTRFYPQYKLNNLPPTPIATLERARNTALEMGLKYVYVGNAPGHKGENTYCPNCKNTVIRRVGYHFLESKLKNGQCTFCGQHIPGIWEKKNTQKLA